MGRKRRQLGSAYYKQKRLNFGPAINQHPMQSQKKTNNSGLLRPKTHYLTNTNSTLRKATDGGHKMMTMMDVNKENAENQFPQYYSYDDRSFMNSTTLNSDQNVKSNLSDIEDVNLTKKQPRRKHTYNNQLSVGSNYYDPFGYYLPQNYQYQHQQQQQSAVFPTYNNNYNYNNLPNSKSALNAVPLDENDPANYINVAGPFIPYCMPPSFAGSYYTTADNTAQLSSAASATAVNMGYNLASTGPMVMESNEMLPANAMPQPMEPYYVAYVPGSNNQMMLCPVLSPAYANYSNFANYANYPNYGGYAGYANMNTYPAIQQPPYTPPTAQVTNQPLQDANEIPNENYEGIISTGVHPLPTEVNVVDNGVNSNVGVAIDEFERNHDDGANSEFYAKTNYDNNNRQL